MFLAPSIAVFLAPSMAALQVSATKACTDAGFSYRGRPQPHAHRYYWQP
jgi:hypothetical protein